MLALAMTVFLSACADPYPETAGALVMDTVFSVTVYGDHDLPAMLLEAASQLDKNVLSRFENGSIVYGYNNGICGEDLSADVSGVMIDIGDILKECEDMRMSSASAFDARIGQLSDLWNIKGYSGYAGEERDSLPNSGQIEAAMEDRSVIDLGAVGKGIYLDLALEILEGSGAMAAVVSAGGSVLVWGEKPDGSEFKVAVRDPFSDSSRDAFATIILSGTHFISTSGSYERYFECGGERYHHIINPLTGYPAWTDEDMERRYYIPPALRSGPAPTYDTVPVSVTVISDSGFYSDALSTACFVLGPDQGIAFAEKYSSEVIYVMDDGTVITSGGIIYDENMKTFRIA
ncbi:MAG: FAD:protein FMN transferase [Lachnospiraceae bacterium]|nr:FAD:protein FMN transferase [Lachnospiraceae bacterium]